MKVSVVTTHEVYTFTDGNDIAQIMSQLDGREWITLPSRCLETKNTKIIQDLDVGETFTQVEVLTNSTTIHKSKIESITKTTETWKTIEKD